MTSQGTQAASHPRIPRPRDLATYTALMSTWHGESDAPDGDRREPPRDGRDDDWRYREGRDDDGPPRDERYGGPDGDGGDGDGGDGDRGDGDGVQEDRPRRRLLRTMIVAVAVVALLGIGAVAAYLVYLNNTVSGNLTYDALLPTAGAPLTDEDGAVVTGEDGSTVTATAPPERPVTAGESLNILLVGTDTRDPSGERGRSDVMVLMHISDERDRVDLVHFPRDLFVDIPGHRTNKLNAAFAFGGTPLLVQTLEPLIGVPVDHAVLVDFDRFQAMTDAIGGVDVKVAEASPGFSQGTMFMDGATGLTFVRERYALSQGDISRGERQQAFIKAILQKALSRETLTNPARLATFADAATSNLVVDEGFDMGRMRELALSLRGVRGDDIHFVTAPWTGIGSDDFAGSIVLLSEEQMAELAEHLAQDTMEDYVDDVSPTSGFG